MGSSPRLDDVDVTYEELKQDLMEKRDLLIEDLDLLGEPGFELLTDGTYLIKIDDFSRLTKLIQRYISRMHASKKMVKQRRKAMTLSDETKRE